MLFYPTILFYGEKILLKEMISLIQNLLWNIPAIIGAIALIASFIIKGYLPPDIGGVGLLALILLILIGSTIGRLVPFIVRVLFPFLSLLLLAMIWSGYDLFLTSEFFVILFIICIMLFGLYLMFFGGFHIFGKRTDGHWYDVNLGYDFIVIISAVGLILGLIAQGLISYYFGITVLVLIVFFLALGRGLSGKTSWWIRILFRYGLPIIALITLFSMNLGKLFI